jgi:hypothetical protein
MTCFFQTAVDAFVCPAAAGSLSGSHLNRPNWLPFKSALTRYSSSDCGSRGSGFLADTKIQPDTLPEHSIRMQN